MKKTTWSTVIACLLLVLSLLVTPACQFKFGENEPATTPRQEETTTPAPQEDVHNPNDPTVLPENNGKGHTTEQVIAPCTWRFVSNGDGTCYISNIEIDSDHTGDMTLVIPEKSPTGDAVVDVQFAFGINELCIPAMMTLEDYNKLIRDPMQKAVEEGALDSDSFKNFNLMYATKSTKGLSKADQEALLASYPLTAVTDLVVLKYVSSVANIIWISSNIKEYSDFTVDAMRESYQRMYTLASQNKIGTAGLPNLCSSECVKKVQIPDSMTQIPASLLRSCASVTEVTLPDSITGISEGAFAGLANLTDLTIPTGVTRIETDAFYGCTGLIRVENGISYVNRWAIDCDDTLVEAVLRSDTLGIADAAFMACHKMKSVAMPDGVTSIGEDAFRECSSLPSVTIPRGLKFLGAHAFDSCYRLDDVYVNDIEAWLRISFDNNGSVGTHPNCYATLHVLDENGNEMTELSLPEDMTSVGSYLFSGWASLTRITIPEGVTNIESGAFYNCKGLTSIVLPDSMTRINRSAFGGCSNLIRVENGVSYVDRWVIGCDENVSSVTLRAGTVGLADFAFSKASSLEAITIPDGLETINYGVFSGCFYLKSIVIPDSVTSIDAAVFANCGNLKHVTIGKGVVSIGHSSFDHCSALESIVVSAENPNYHVANKCLIETQSKTLLAAAQNATIPTDGSVTGIGKNAFSGYDWLQNISIPYGITSIGDYAFEYCEALTDVTIPNSVTSIGYAAFYGCKSIEHIMIPDSVTSIDSCAFSHCSALTRITIPDSVTYIGYYAFIGCNNLIQTENDVSYVNQWVVECKNGPVNVILRADTVGIASLAFRWNTPLISITIPEGVKNINDNAFSTCRDLTHIYYQGTESEWNRIKIGESSIPEDAAIYFAN